MKWLGSAPLWDWINERHAIYIRKSLREGLLPEQLHVPRRALKDLQEADPLLLAAYPNCPLTEDAVLNTYRFCNVFRELDRVTAWIRYNIRRKWADHPDLWFMLAIARTINWPPMLEWLIDERATGAWPGEFSLGDAFWDPERMAEVMQHAADTGAKVYTGAYMIRAESDRNKEWYSWSKHEYISKIVLGRLWEDREAWRISMHNGKGSLQTTWDLFQEPRYIGWGPFMAYQVVVDLRWTQMLENAPDINTWAALGPGSRRGLNRLAGRPVDYPLSQKEGLEEMRALWAEQDRHRAPWVPRIDLSDIQNALCETDKYLRVKNGEGKPRSLYIPGRGY